MTEAGNDDLAWDENGRLTQGRNQYKFYYDWDGRLKDVNDAGDNYLVTFKYDALGNRVYRGSTFDGGFVVYSIGENGIDDDAKGKDSAEKSSGDDISFTVKK